MAVYFCYIVKSDLSSVQYVNVNTWLLFPRSLKNTAMFDWSPCTDLDTLKGDLELEGVEERAGII